ncbi:MAG: hypothetical protein HOE11_02585 [Candidatus Diapherotrites archaeon]|jgi:hypothetical protein|nr:hypothetical protein [Candidatus Diapherotrites archaeon]MBT4597064.1 hypothetical protein [Candidatus Diapherotrites archaeon]
MAHSNQLLETKRLQTRARKAWERSVRDRYTEADKIRLRLTATNLNRFIDSLKTVDMTQINSLTTHSIKTALKKLTTEISLLPPEARRIQLQKLLPIRSRLQLAKTGSKVRGKKRRQ